MHFKLRTTTAITAAVVVITTISVTSLFSPGNSIAETTTTSTNNTATISCESMTPFGKPIVYTETSSSLPPPRYLCRKLYVLEHSATRKTAYWSAERLIGKDLGFSEERVNAFRADPDLPKNEASTPNDYKKSGYDQGHLAPVGDMHKDKEAMLESFYLSNMVPQVPGHNRDGWNHLESYVRELAQSRGELFVITGPVYKCKFNTCETIGISRVHIPTHLYKIVYDPKQHVAMSFMVPNIPFTMLDLPKYQTTVANIEKATNVKFFPATKSPIKDSVKLWTSKSSN